MQTASSTRFLSWRDRSNASVLASARATSRASSWMLRWIPQRSRGPDDRPATTTSSKQQGISMATLRRVKKDLGVKARKERGKVDGEWFWEMPKMAKPAGGEREIEHLPNVRPMNILVWLVILEGAQGAHLAQPPWNEHLRSNRQRHPVLAAAQRRPRQHPGCRSEFACETQLSMPAPEVPHDAPQHLGNPRRLARAFARALDTSNTREYAAHLC